MQSQPQPGTHHHQNGFLYDYAEGLVVGALVRDFLSGWRHPWIGIGSLLVGCVSGLAVTSLSYFVVGSSLWQLVPAVVAFVACARIPKLYDRHEDRVELAGVINRERRYRHGYRASLAEVATEAELSRLDGLWDRERSYDEDRFWLSLLDRWADAYPAIYPSQDQARLQGLLCRCDPSVGGHCCLRHDGIVSLPALERELARLGGNPAGHAAAERH